VRVIIPIIYIYIYPIRSQQVGYCKLLPQLSPLTPPALPSKSLFPHDSCHFGPGGQARPQYPWPSMPQHGRHGHGHVAELISGSNAHHRVKNPVSISDSLAGAAAIIFTIVHLVHNRMAPSSRGSREVLINPTFEKKSTIPLPSFLQLTARPHLRWQSEALMGNAESCCYTGADQPIIIEFQALNCHKGLTLTVGS